MSNQTHELKTVQPYFDAVASGRKTFEIRKNDRGFREGDLLVLREWDGEEYTGEKVTVKITYITDYAQSPLFRVLGISLVSQADSGEDGERFTPDWWLGFRDAAEWLRELSDQHAKGGTT